MSENQRRLGDLTINDTAEAAASSQMLEDEKFAIMLQNEEFMAELRGNREFLSALEEEASGGGSDYLYHQQQQQQEPAAAKKAVGPPARWAWTMPRSAKS